MKIKGISKIYATDKKLRCTFVLPQDINHTVEVDLESTDSTNVKIRNKVDEFAYELMKIFEKDIL